MRHWIGFLMAGVALLPACVAPVGTTTASVLNSADAPKYLATPSHRAISRNCLKSQRGGFGELPPGCMKDSAFANQVAYPHDLTDPHTPGPTSPRTSAIAAAPYYSGDPVADAANTGN